MTVLGDAEENVAVPEAPRMAESFLPDAIECSREIGEVGRAEYPSDDGTAITLVVAHVGRLVARRFDSPRALQKPLASSICRHSSLFQGALAVNAQPS
jgi:hypothetical protein